MGISSVLSLLDSTVTIEPFKSDDQYGVPTLGAKKSVKARIQQGLNEIKTSKGHVLVGRYKVILGEPVQIDPRDVITLPKEYGVRNEDGEFHVVSPPIIEVRPVFLRGQHDHTVLILGDRSTR